MNRPEGAENPYNAWCVKSEVQGAPTGQLRGKRIALEDDVCLAGVPMMNGASSLEGYVPDVDATVVTRILEAGGGPRQVNVRTAACTSALTGDPRETRIAAARATASASTGRGSTSPASSTPTPPGASAPTSSATR
jgi:hypothetical protein